MYKFAIVATAVALSALASWLILGGFPAMAWVSCLVTSFVVSKLMLTNMMPMGHGVNGVRHLLGMPVFNFCAYLFILVLILLLAVPAASFTAETRANLKALEYALFIGWTAGLIDWYGESSRLTHYVLEYGIRLALKNNGFSEEQIDKEVDKMRTEGLIAPLSKEELEMRKNKPV